MLLLAAVAYGLACETQPNNNNSTPNANTSPSPTLGNTNGNTNTAPNYEEVPIDIVVTDTSIEAPRVVDLSGDKKALWQVKNSSSTPDVTVVIGAFRNEANPSQTQPFGTGSCDNEFTLNHIERGETNRDISDPASGQAGTYEYDITVRNAEGKEIRKLDPQIIVGSRNLPPGSDKGAAKTASPSPSPAASPRKP